jgi:hypothetical protein
MSNSASAENTRTTDTLSSFDADGFTLTPYSSDAFINYTGRTMVAWCFKAGGAAVANTDGTVASQVSANVAGGFSIVGYTGNGTAGSTIGTGLSAPAEMIIVKSTSISDNWWTWHKELTSIDYYLTLNNITDETYFAGNIFGGTLPTSSVFSVGADFSTNGLNNELIAYCWHSVAGYSKISSYVGNGNTTGVLQELGFEPAFLMFKCSSQVGNWIMIDNKRATSNPRTPHLRANTISTDDYGANEYVDFTSTGFQPKGVSNYNNNSNNQTYIYMAFA